MDFQKIGGKGLFWFFVALLLCIGIFCGGCNDDRGGPIRPVWVKLDEPTIPVVPDKIEIDASLFQRPIKIQYEWDYDREKMLWKLRGHAFVEGMLEGLDGARFDKRHTVLMQKLGLVKED